VGQQLAPAVLHGGCFARGSGTWRGNGGAGSFTAGIAEVMSSAEDGGIGPEIGIRMEGDDDGKRH
jgi:hypothetical protein